MTLAPKLGRINQTPPTSQFELEVRLPECKGYEPITVSALLDLRLETVDLLTASNAT